MPKSIDENALCYSHRGDSHDFTKPHDPDQVTQGGQTFRFQEEDVLKALSTMDKHILISEVRASFSSSTRDPVKLSKDAVSAVALCNGNSTIDFLKKIDAERRGIFDLEFVKAVNSLLADKPL
ncbi:hypothetical protein K3727_12560 [Rhodobacteraceae bacterium M382]|nr:hypothetical protein K3727_12560 [Rhodobacteraceae bacterium M382]